MKKLKIILLTLTVAALTILCTGCASCNRGCKDWRSDVNNGLNRIVIVYDVLGNELKRYEGKIDLPERDDARIEFEYNGKRIIWYNAIIEVVEK